MIGSATSRQLHRLFRGRFRGYREVQRAGILGEVAHHLVGRRKA